MIAAIIVALMRKLSVHTLLNKLICMWLIENIFMFNIFIYTYKCNVYQNRFPHFKWLLAFMHAHLRYLLLFNMYMGLRPKKTNSRDSTYTMKFMHHIDRYYGLQLLLLLLRRRTMQITLIQKLKNDMQSKRFDASVVVSGGGGSCFLSPYLNPLLLFFNRKFKFELK